MKPLLNASRVFEKIFTYGKKGFVKHDLKGVLKCIRVKIWTHYPPPPPPTDVTDIIN
jgi:hypothetical protein